MYNLRAMHRRMSGNQRLPTLAFGMSNFAIGTPATGNVPLGILPILNGALALVFQSVVTSTDQYGSAFPPSGGGYATLSGTADPTPAVISKAFANGQYSDSIPLSGAVYDIVTCACTFIAPQTRNLVQQLAGGALLTAGANTRTLLSNVAAGNTVVIGIQSASPSHGAVSSISSILDNLGNVWKPLTSVTIFNPTFNQFHQLFVFWAKLTRGGASTITINVGGAAPGTANSWIGEFHFT